MQQGAVVELGAEIAVSAAALSVDLELALRQRHPRDRPQVQRGTPDAGRGLRGYRRCPLSNVTSVAAGQGKRRSTDDPCLPDCAAADRHLTFEYAPVNGVQSVSNPRATQHDAPRASIPTGGRLHATVDRDCASGGRLRSGNGGIPGNQRRPRVRHPGQSSAPAETRQRGKRSTASRTRT